MRLREWFLATRPWSFPMTVVSVSLGAVLAAQEGFFSPPLYLLTLLGILMFHAATNLLNDYYDVKHGVDGPGAPTAKYRRHPILTGEFTPESFRNAVAVLYLFVIAAASYLALLRGWPIIVLTVAGLLISVFYTADPIKFKHYPVGELFVFSVWGPLLVAGTHYVLTGALSLRAALASTPIGVLVALVLLANNLRDMEYDGALGLRTLAVVIGRERGIKLYRSLLFLVYALLAALVSLRVLSAWSLLALLTLPKALSLSKLFSQRIPEAADPITAQLLLLFGVLLVSGELAAVFLPI